MLIRDNKISYHVLTIFFFLNCTQNRISRKVLNMSSRMNYCAPITHNRKSKYTTLQQCHNRDNKDSFILVG